MIPVVRPPIAENNYKVASVVDVVES